MFKQVITIVALSISLPTLADWVTITSVQQVELGYNSAGDAAVIGGVGTAISGGDAWEVLGGVVGGAIIGDVVSDYRDGVEIRIRNAKGRSSTIVQDGQIRQFKLGDAELQEVHHNGEKKLRVVPNA
ncbi:MULTISPECIES: hypothetical protein [Vibrio]|uniref:Glycine zipper 2TM domain-containing protein n=1 Tax=Vibrio splendidus TaxID=29497 RepID=A0A2N7FDX4_VIBSP|nr:MULTISPECIES: hypothetical protein [Vibrio]OMO29574.1 hypothetical protein BH581_08310 [Vibrio splendidus]PMJ67509.1 hypothetical protein BCU17_17220 [Vibrio splendidus]UQV24249.1 hypothetical protein M4S28_18495 [Vibrio sp. J383]|tara:strand:+ start:131 stop:511 length:381 start_codon:yes stop_codon:yes gene_type:complete